jgi:hypothetical protein
VIIFFASVAVAVSVLIVHLIYGLGCWGFQPGGHAMMALFTIQVATSLVAMVILAWRSWHRTGTKPHFFLLIGSIASVLCVWQFCSVGGRMYASVHDQGIENLPTFIFCLLPGLLVGIQQWGFNRSG